MTTRAVAYFTCLVGIGRCRGPAILPTHIIGVIIEKVAHWPKPIPKGVLDLLPYERKMRNITVRKSAHLSSSEMFNMLLRSINRLPSDVLVLHDASVSGDDLRHGHRARAQETNSANNNGLCRSPCSK